MNQKAAFQRLGLRAMSLASALTLGVIPALLSGAWYPSSAAFPGQNGKIAFSSSRDGNGEIYAMNPDGSEQTNLTNNPMDDGMPAWSPDGSRLVFVSNRDGNGEIYVMDADGSNQTRLTNDPSTDIFPSWSPDGSQIVFARFALSVPNYEIWVMNSDGSDLRRLTENTAEDVEPVWSPDGTKIAFRSWRDGNMEIYSMDPDGGNQTNLTNNGAEDGEPDWSPDGSQIVFSSNRDGYGALWAIGADGSGPHRLTDAVYGDGHPAWSPDGTKIVFKGYRAFNDEIYVMNADGTDIRRLTDSGSVDWFPDWQPVPVHPITYLVNTTDDTNGTCDEGHCSLREAINAANAHPGADTIAFGLPGNPPFTVVPTSGLPAVVDPVTIDGTTQAGYEGAPVVEISGEGVSGEPSGILVFSGHTTVKGLVVNRFPGNGIQLEGTGGNVIEGNFVGTDTSGMLDHGNGGFGVAVWGSAENLIEGNLISGNAGDGIGIFAPRSTANTVKGNLVGTDADGDMPVPNEGQGIWIGDGASDTVIGGEDAEARNVISGNMSGGVSMGGPGGNLVQGNYIGTDASGTAPLPNTSYGVTIAGSAGNTVESNVISGNTGGGVGVASEGSTGNMILGNRIGTSMDGSAALGNPVGVWLGGGAVDTRIGGTSDADRNIISGNSGDGISINGPAAGTLVQGNYMGTDASGTTPLPNGSNGIVLVNGTHDNRIGGSASGAGNLISGNAGTGIVLSNDGTTGNLVQGNLIGTDVSGASTTGAGGPPLVDFTVTTEPETCPTYEAGADIDGFVSQSNDPLAPWSGQSVHFRGQDPEEPHDPDACHATETLDGIPLVYRYKLDFGVVAPLTSIAVSGAAFNGGVLRVLDENMQVLAAASTFGGNSFFTNYITLQGVEGRTFYVEEFDWSASWRFRQSIVVNPPLMGNRGSGVSICCGASGNTVGGSSDGARNIISGNMADGIGISDAGTTGNAVLGNYVGTDLSGTVDLGNGANGVALVGGASENLVGGTGEEARNIISGNTWNGVAIFNPGTTANRVQGNYIGTDVTGGAPLGNSAPGIGIGDQASGNLIGGADPGAGNLISGNISDGIAIFNNGTTANNILGNLVGTDAAGGGQVSNQGAGVWIGDGASNTTIGGVAEGARNVISGNNADGISINDAGTTGIVVQGNYIGTDIHGNMPLPNGGNGVILVNGTHHNMVGGPDEGAGNLITGNSAGGVGIADSPDNAVVRNSLYANADTGVWIWGAGSTGNTVQSNLIGTDPAGTAGLGNEDGVWIGGGATNNTIGGVTPGTGNVISGNRIFGVSINNEGTAGNLVQGNLIGTDPTGATALPNSAGGVVLSQGPGDNSIGGAQHGAGNTIAFNTGPGVLASSDAGSGNAILANAIHHNADLGIDLAEDGVTPNDPRDRDSGPNGLQNFPVLSQPVLFHGSFKVAGILWSKPNATYRIEFFEVTTCDPTGYGEGDRYLGFKKVRTGPLGFAAFVFQLPPGFEARASVAATTTDSAGSTSEFSHCSGPARHVGGGR